jgi:hypothetical protein
MAQCTGILAHGKAYAMTRAATTILNLRLSIFVFSASAGSSVHDDSRTVVYNEKDANTFCLKGKKRTEMQVLVYEL